MLYPSKVNTDYYSGIIRINTEFHQNQNSRSSKKLLHDS